MDVWLFPHHNSSSPALAAPPTALVSQATAPSRRYQGNPQSRLLKGPHWFVANVGWRPREAGSFEG